VFLTLVDEIRQESRPPETKGEAICRRHEAAEPQAVQDVPLGGWTRATLCRLCDDLAVPQHLMLRETLRLAGLDGVPGMAVRL
jgi:hypothetical protein